MAHLKLLLLLGLTILPRLSGPDEIRTWFEARTGQPRLILWLSPT